jgi:hypothetical protein
MVENFDYKKYIAEGKLLKEETVSTEELVNLASSIQGERIISTIDDFESYLIFPPKDVIEKIADEYNVGYFIKKYPENQSIIFYNKSHPKSKQAINLYNNYMEDFSSLTNDDHALLGTFFGYSNDAIKDFIDDQGEEIPTFNKNSLQPQKIFQVGKTYELTQDIPQNIKYNPNLSPVGKSGDKFKVTDISPNPTNEWWVIDVDSITYPEREYLDFRIEPHNVNMDKYDKFVFKNLK